MNKHTSKLVFFIAALLWGASYPFQKPLLDIVPPVVFTFWNFFISGAIFLAYALYKKIPLFYRWKEGVVLGIFISGVEIFEMVGLHMSTSANTVFLNNIGMLIIPFVGYLLFKSAVKVEDCVAIILAIIGMYMLVGGVSGFSFGDAIILLSALSSAFYFIYSERFEAERARHITTLCIQQFFVISAICFVWTLYDGAPLAVPQSLHLVLLWQIIIFTTVPYAIIQWGSRYADEMVAAVYDGIVEPLTGAILSWFVFMEATTPVKIAGGMLMALSFVFAALYSQRNFMRHLFRKVDKEIVRKIEGMMPS
jgi:drug/metabolite transporter (DMT)-like permease